MRVNGFTPVESRMLGLLRDGLAHKREELHACLDDDLADLTAIQPHICRIRKRLNSRGEDILCVARGYTYSYQHIRLLSSANDGRK
jgi:hypothetical protein